MKTVEKETFSVGDSITWLQAGEILGEKYSQGPFRVSEVIPVPVPHCECGADNFFKSGSDPWPEEDIPHSYGCPKDIGNSVGHHQWVKVVDADNKPVGENSLYSMGGGTPGATFSGSERFLDLSGHGLDAAPDESRGLFLFLKFAIILFMDDIRY